ncbi:hypothetical protein L211DRAFT_852930 [Terfezia boudieri ATCC MYA-4762]|uniref:Uncharacterized protein n=1 Tax=Terfezia boudieri ATCC MYA-4762 TaxID=1051890 RepID=A0A3N4LE32_9PEZI|nr:hypothetical protein L211DRAFT_852930 [Terfezia boudieri ATCC MYA-4762]
MTQWCSGHVYDLPNGQSRTQGRGYPHRSPDLDVPFGFRDVVVTRTRDPSDPNGVQSQQRACLCPESSWSNRGWSMGLSASLVPVQKPQLGAARNVSTHPFLHNPLSATKKHKQGLLGGMQDKQDSLPRPPGITSQMSRDENAQNDGAEGGPHQSSSWKFRQENLRPIRRNFLCDAYREAGTQIIGSAPGPPTLLAKTCSGGEKTGGIPSSMWDTNPVLREIKALITPYKLPNQVPMTSGAVPYTTQGSQEKQGRNDKGKTPVSKEMQEAKGSDGIYKTSTAAQNTGVATHIAEGAVGPSFKDDMDARMCLPQGQTSNQGTQGQPDLRPVHDQPRTPAPSSAMQPPQRFHFHAQPPKRDFRVIFPDLNPTWFNDEGLIQLPPLRRRHHASAPRAPSDIDVHKRQVDPSS